MPTTQKAGPALTELDKVITRLLDPQNGCPWDLKQTPASIIGHLLEETYELIEALKAENPDDICEEAGDLLFQVIFISHLAQPRWGWGLAEVIDQVQAKMITRHPHIFGDGPKITDTKTVLNQWQTIKRQDKKYNRLLASVPLTLPALQRAHRLNDRVERAGFNWLDTPAVRHKVDEKLAEMDKQLALYDPQTTDPAHKTRLKAEMGNVLLALANLASRLDFSAEDALSEANTRFINRFNYIEDKLAASGQRPEDVSPATLEELWQQAKATHLSNPEK
ncbi:MAG: nucleoside triphosphate pyrophosphohydrolase [Candidatus Adiutrix intracellularis]|jgi:tetrapyrrole methylase family protein/MazG family protein|nr:nucleoside triphosphate pyrophosphohydrolase [Candidatus Adiutrix intracellularis]